MSLKNDAVVHTLSIWSSISTFLNITQAVKFYLSTFVPLSFNGVSADTLDF